MVKYALITGCSAGGIGDALAQEFHRNGVHVFATARNLAKIEHLKVQGLTILQLDVLSPESIRKAVVEVDRVTGGRLDFLVNNAGMGNTMPLLDVKIDAAREVFELNYFALLAVTQAFAPSLIAAKGKVLNIGSIVGRIAQAYTGIYNSSKAAVNLLSESLRVELAPFGVQVITVITGVIKTEFFTKQGNVDLPADSLYTSIHAKINEVGSGSEIMADAMSPAVFAKGVVANALKPKSKLWYWRGANALLVWFVTVFAPHLLPDRIFAKTNGLDKLVVERGKR